MLPSRLLLLTGILRRSTAAASSSTAIAAAAAGGARARGATATAATAVRHAHHRRQQQQQPALPIARGFSSNNRQQQAIMSIQASIEAKLQQELQPTHMQVLNESHMHNVPKGAETHFKVILVSAAFEGKPLLGRHRVVNALLDAELKGGVHALSIVAKTPGEWAASQGAVPPSPQCRGGSKH